MWGCHNLCRPQAKKQTSVSAEGSKLGQWDTQGGLEKAEMCTVPKTGIPDPDFSLRHSSSPSISWSECSWTLYFWDRTFCLWPIGDKTVQEDLHPPLQVFQTISLSVIDCTSFIHPLPGILPTLPTNTCRVCKSMGQPRLDPLHICSRSSSFLRRLSSVIDRMWVTSRREMAGRIIGTGMRLNDSRVTVT